jgi:hypothetical protein
MISVDCWCKPYFWDMATYRYTFSDVSDNFSIAIFKKNWLLSGSRQRPAGTRKLLSVSERKARQKPCLQRPIYSPFADKVQRSCHFAQLRGETAIIWASLFYCSCQAILDWNRENLIACGGDSWIYSLEVTCVQLYRWTNCISARLIEWAVWNCGEPSGRYMPGGNVDAKKYFSPHKALVSRLA